MKNRYDLRDMEAKGDQAKCFILEVEQRNKISIKIQGNTC